tara:strand:+ start:4260 stop:4454 length:195 start_codon:yes stop_codon:yes gene_type:complete
MDEDIYVQALIKQDGEKYIFLYRRDRWKEVIYRIVEMHKDSDLSLDYRDMLNLTVRIKKSAYEP